MGPRLEAAPRTQRTPARRRRLRVAALALGSTVAILAAELAIRIVVAVRHPSLMVVDDELGWRHAAGVERTLQNELGQRVVVAFDERGLRATPHPTARTPGVARVLVVGDSFVEGAMADAPDLWTVLLDARLGDEVEIFNGGHGGYGTVQQLLWLQRDGLAFAPDVVVHVVFANDLFDNTTPFLEGVGARPFATLDGGELRLHPVDAAAFEPFLMPFPFRTWFHRHSALYRSLHKNVFLPAAGARLRDDANRRRDATPVAVQREVLLALLERMQQTVSRAGASWVLVLAPSVVEAAARRSETHAVVAEWAAARGIPCLSLLDAVQPASPDDAPSYLPLDTHWTREGHARVAAAVEPFVRAAVDPGAPRPR